MQLLQKLVQQNKPIIRTNSRVDPQTPLNCVIFRIRKGKRNNKKGTKKRELSNDFQQD